MKKSLAVFLFLCLIIPFAGIYSVLHFQKKTVKKKVKREIIAGLNESELVLLKFNTFDTKTKLNWEHSKEFEYEDQMYDIVKAKHFGDSIYYWCWWDSEETMLNKKLNKLVVLALGSNPNHKEKQQCLLDLFKSLYHSNYSHWTSPPFEAQTKTFPEFQFALASASSSPPVPPPEFF